MNAYETYYAPIRKDSNPVNLEKRNTQSLFLAVASIVLFILLLGVRFTYMGDCEGKGLMGKVLSIFVFGSSAFVIGTNVYLISKLCGARSSDLFGVLSQILPQSATDMRPVVCSAS
jgi:phosphoglycerol transferase MdoB-like AlkP superfamily enzyme